MQVSTSNQKIIACIGARDTPESILSIMEHIGYALAQKGRQVRSGGALGADHRFQKGVMRYCHENGVVPSSRQQIYLPYNGFKGSFASDRDGIIDFQKTLNKKRAIEMAKLHYIDQKKVANWPDWMENLMGRNTYQILGDNLNEVVTSVICYTKDGSLDGSNKSSGGTGQALRLAAAYNRPVFNLKNEKHLAFVVEHLLGEKKLSHALLTPQY